MRQNQTYHYMKTFLHNALFFCAASTLMSAPAVGRASEPVAPGNLNAEVNGLVVDLSWEWGNAGKCTLSESFEGTEFPPAGWEVDNYYSYDEYGNWMLYDFCDDDPEVRLCHDGTKCAVLQIGAGDESDPETMHQDEWLIMHPGVGASYMDFWYYLHPELLEVGGYMEFPDHYYVMVSRDNGKSWDELWDGRWDMGSIDGVQQASLFLGEEADENTLVAFNAVSGDEESLYFLWCVDDVRFYSAEEAAQRSLMAAAPHRNAKMGHALAGKPLYRQFTPAPNSVKKVISREDWLNNGNITYRVYLDDEMLTSYLKARHYSDYSTKSSGSHTYRVMAWSEELDQEFASASVDVNIADFDFPAPRNLKVAVTAQSNGKYTVEGSWDEPEGDLQPVNYEAYINGKSIGWIESGEELSMGQTGLFKGVYEFEVEARYQFPEGVSERISAVVFPGTFPTPVGLNFSEDGEDVKLSWQTLENDGVSPSSFKLYRGDVLIADNIEDKEFTDINVPDGSYLYSVHGVYGDGSVSLPDTVSYIKGIVAPLQLPVKENFTNGHLPAGWKVELSDPYGRVKDMYSWRFDNWFDNEIPAESGLTDGFASVDGVAAGMNRLESFIYSPVISLPAVGNSVLTFTKYFIEGKPGPSGPAVFEVAVAPVEEEMFYLPLADLASADNGEVKVSLDYYAGMDVVLRWGFLSRNSGFAAIDNVKVEDESSAALLPAEGDVYDVFAVDGNVVGRNVSGSYIQNLPSGIYIMRDANGNTAKIVKE